jgi:hypothetical protein
MINLITLFANVANLTYPTACTGYACLLSYGNSVTSGLMGIIINCVFFAIILMGTLLSGIDLEAAGLVSGFISLWIGVALVGMSLLTPYFLFVWVAVMAIFFILSWTKGVSNPYG